MKKIALMCDSSADITKEEAEKLGIHVLRMPITINGKEFYRGRKQFPIRILSRHLVRIRVLKRHSRSSVR